MGTTPATRPAEHGSAEPAAPLAEKVTFGWPLPAMWRRPALRDLAMVVIYLAVAGWLTHGLWPDPATRELLLNPDDQILIEWFLAVDTQVIFGDQGLVTDRLNPPDGVNLLANASSLLLGLLLAPVTLTAGAPVSFAVLTIGSLAATAAAWYLLFARTLATPRPVAALAGACCGFSPAMVSHSNSHWHIAAQWLVPAIVWSVVRLARAASGGDLRRVVTSGLWLAALVVAQYFLGAEVLYLTAVTLALFVAGYALARREWARRVLPGFAAGLAVATGAASVVLAYPLWVQFAGPGSVTDGPFDPHFFSADLLSWSTLSPLSLAGSDAAADLATGAAEYNAFLGWPLLLVVAGCAGWLWREPLVRAASGAALVMGVLSLGPELLVNQRRTGIWLPYAALADLPVIDAALPQRYAVAVVPLLTVILVRALRRAGRRDRRTRVMIPVAVGLSLLPLVPTPLPTGDRVPVPAFISQGHWRECVAPGGVLVPVPLPTPQAPEPMRWASAANAGFAVPEGFFIGPYGRGGGPSIGTFKQPTSALLAEVAATGVVPRIGPEQQAQARADLRFWGAQCVVLADRQPHRVQLAQVVSDLLGENGEVVADVRIWRV